MNPTLLVLAAGMGSRYGGLKQLDAMGPGGETLLDYSVHDALRAGFGCLTFVIRRDFEDVFRRQIGAKYEKKTEVRYVFQEIDMLPEGFSVPAGRQKPWGTTHAIWCARDAVREPFAAINADDFYGAEAYEKLAAFLRNAPLAVTPAQFAMVGYQLGRTLSEHGAVARGVCTVDARDHLSRVVEYTRIEKTATGAAQQNPDGSVTQFTGNEPVSMNFWGFTPAVFPMLGDELLAFLQTYGNDLKAEALIPTTVCRLVEQGRASVRVLRTGGVWFGVTYREDKPRVQAALKQLVAEGRYPERLW